MPIPLNQNVTRPSVKLPYVGSGIEVCVIGTRQIPWTEFGSNNPKIGTDGKPRKQLLVTGIVVSQHQALTGPQGQERPVNIGEVVDLYLHGHQWGSYIEAERAFTTAGFTAQVGDILLQHFTHTERSAQAGANDKKVKAITFRRARPDEAHYVAQAEALYYSLRFDVSDPQAGQPDTAEPEPFPSNPAYGAQPTQPQQPAYATQGAPYGGGAPSPAPSPYGAQAPQQQPVQQPIQYPAQPQQAASPYPRQDGPGF